MFEKRPIWGLIVGLNVCILIWLISVQERVVYDINTAALSSTNNYITNTGLGTEGGLPAAAALVEQQRVNNGWSRDLLSKHITTAQSNEYVDETSPAVSNITTLNFNSNNNNYKNNNNSNNINNNSTANTKQQIAFSHNFFDVETTTKTSDLSFDMQSLTSSLGTGVVDLKTKPTPSWAKLTAVASALPHKDFNQLIDLQNFQFLLPQPVCGNHIEALILIHSAPKNYEKRQVIRETWASISEHTTESPLRILFLLGAVNSEQQQSEVHSENNIHRDIIQGSFIDDYRNMTYKHIMAFKWFLYNCPQAQILIKVDDDVYVNTPQLIKYLKEQQQSQRNDKIKSMNNNVKPTIATTVTLNKTTATNTTTTTITNNNNTITSSTSAISTTTTTTTATTRATSSSIFHILNIFASASPSATASSSSRESLFSAFNASEKLFKHPKNLLFCQKIVGALVKRSYRSKWRVSFKEYSERYYPPYCPGYAIIYSPDVIFRLYTAAQNTKYFWIDDVHITGVLAQQTNTTITNSSHYVLYSDECDKILTGKTDLRKTEFLFAWHSISAQKIKLLWHLQMMNIQTLNDLHYRKLTTNEDDNVADDVYEMPQYQRRQQRQQSSKSKYNNDGISSSSHTYTSANGSR